MLPLNIGFDLKLDTGDVNCNRNQNKQKQKNQNKMVNANTTNLTLAWNTAYGEQK